MHNIYKPTNVQQHVSLNTDYSNPGTGSVGGRNVTSAAAGPPKAKQSLNAFQRWCGRNTQNFKDLWAKRLMPIKGVRIASHNDWVQGQRASRFNARHRKFSQRVSQNNLALAQPGGTILKRTQALKTLRNDMLLLKKDNPHVDDFQLLQGRLDVDLNSLSNAEIVHFGKNVRTAVEELKNKPQDQTTDSDKADLSMLQAMEAAFVRHTYCRTDAAKDLTNSVINPASTMEQASNAAKTSFNALHDKLSLAGLSDADLERQTTHGLEFAIRSHLTGGTGARRAPANTEILGKINQNLNNSTQAWRKQGNFNRTVYADNKELRIANRVVRSLYLEKLAADNGFTDEHAVSRDKFVGSGAAHTVVKVKYEGQNQPRVFKADDDSIRFDLDGNKKTFRLGGELNFNAARAIGIDSNSPRLLERSVLTSRIEQKLTGGLGYSIAAKTDFAVHEGQLGAVQEFAPGKPAMDPTIVKEAFNKDKAALQKQLTMLHVLDTITGQTDRHHNNYMIDTADNGTVTVTAIDSDFCMGGKLDDPEDIQRVEGSHLPQLPPVVDKAMAANIRNMSASDLRELCGNLASEQEITAAVSRLNILKTHIASLETAGAVIEPTEWGTAKADALLENTDAFLDAASEKVDTLDAKADRYRKNISGKLLSAAKNAAKTANVEAKLESYFQKIANGDDVSLSDLLRKWPDSSKHGFLVKQLQNLQSAVDRVKMVDEMKQSRDTIRQIRSEISTAPNLTVQQIRDKKTQMWRHIRNLSRLTKLKVNSYYARDVLPRT